MTGRQAIRFALEMTASDLAFIEEMRDAPLTQPVAGAAHPTWVIGHLTVAEGRLHQILTGEPNPAADLKPLFDWGTTPRADASLYPPIDGLLARFRALRARTLALLDALDDAVLDGPTRLQPPGLEQAFGKVGETLLTIASHQAFHCGQASLARRAAGKPPHFQPSAALRAF